MIRALGALVLLATTTSGCATIFASKTANVSVTSNVQGAQVIVDGQPAGVTPTTVTVVHKVPHNITVRMPGYSDVRCVLTPNIGALWIVLDVFGTGLLGLVIDAITNDWKQLPQTNCFASFAVPAGGVAPAQPAPYTQPPAGPPTAPPPGQPPAEGMRGGPCYPNFTCNNNLVCDRETGRCLAPQ